MYNAEAFIRDTLLSIFAQKYQNIEVIVVNDGSTDNSRDIVLSDFPQCVLIQETNSGGCSHPRNEGAKQAKGTFITFFDADDIMCPWKIETQVEFLAQHDEIEAVYVDYQNFSKHKQYPFSHYQTCPTLQDRLKISGKASLILSSSEARQILIKENYVIANSPLIRMDAFKNIGGFDENLKASEDFELCYRLSMKYSVGIINVVGFNRRLHTSNMSFNPEKILKYKILSRLTILSYEKNKDLKKEIRKSISQYFIALGYHYIGRRNSLALWNTVKSIKYGLPSTKYLARNIVKGLLFAALHKHMP
jgi:glycosyltransferase involved in cell wall biosynthesis